MTSPQTDSIMVSDLSENSTNDVPITIIPALYISVCSFPMLLMLCTFGNILNIYVLFRYEAFCVKEVLLLFLAASDLLVMWAALPGYLVHHQALLKLTRKGFYCAVSVLGVFKWLQYSFQTTSDLILVLFSLERLAAFRFAEQHRWWRTETKKASVVVMGVIVFSAVLMMEHVVSYYHFIPVGSKQEWLSRWYIMQQFIDVVFPLVVTGLLLFLNLWLIVYITKLRSSTDLELRRLSDSARETLRNNSDRCLTKMNRVLLGCVGMYFTTQLPVMILNSAVYFSGPQNLTSIQHLQPLVWTFSLVNYSANFLVYVGFSRSYRETLCHLNN